MVNITAAVLCGGQGTRLRPVIGDLPKCLAPVAGKPFLEYILEHLKEQGIVKVVLCVGYGAEQVEDRFGGGEYEGLYIRYSREIEPLGSGGALRHALPLLDSDPVLVLNGDTFCKFNLEDILPCYTGWAATLGNTGIQLLSPRLIGCLPQEKSDIGRMLGWIISDEGTPFHDIGTPERYAAAEEFLRQQGVLR